MSDFVFYIAIVWLVVLFCLCVLMVSRAKSGFVRVVSLDALTLVLVALLIVYSTTTHTSFYLDAALVLALISFISVVATVRYYGERRLF